ncbi:hypothetical protein [Streptomyces sp. NBC_01185]|uniref:hypothetical protein n=1 Tax=Streptomyces sp. NBC_01185 TaxID=2903764 RepID=UPI003870742A|nr:hypothetical protein OG770_14330 [Streptomyces sp. NBC_01185]
MPDRLRTALGHPLPERASTLMRERQSSSPDSSSGSGSPSGSGSSSGSSKASGSSGSPGAPGSSGSSGSSDDNPFAAPPEDRPDQPWQPRHPSHAPGNQGNGGSGDGSEGQPDDRPVWGSQWSDQQPGRQNGGFGGRPAGSGGPGGQGGGPENSPGGLRWDPTDPAQRRARYAVLGGMWAFFFALFDFPEIAMLLGALAVYWSISALRGGPRKPPATGTGSPAATGGSTPDRATPPPAPGAAPGAAPGTAQISSRQQTTAAVSGLVTALLALAIVATGYTVQLVYRDYYTCVNDALTKSGALACNEKLPDPLEPFFGVKK